MARKVFVSYKYSDTDVQPLVTGGGLVATPYTTARSYVDVLSSLLVAAGDHIYKGENDGESLAGFKDEYIESKLRDKIFDSSVTIVLISKNMIDPSLPETDQWIPWEVAYSLKEMTRNGRTSGTNAMLAVVLPDKTGSYSYFVEAVGCPHCGSVKWKQDTLFSVLGKNMFNRLRPNTNTCPNGMCGPVHYGQDHSFIYPVTWNEFRSNVNYYLEHAISLRDRLDEFEVFKTVDC